MTKRRAKKTSQDKLPIPHSRMTPEEKGVLLRVWIDAGVTFFAKTNGDTEGLDWADIKVDPFDFMYADLRGPMFYGVELNCVNLARANASGVQFVNCTLGSAILYRADLSGAVFAGSSLNHAILDEANIEGADFGLCDLEGASLKSCVGIPCNVSGAIIDFQTFVLSGWGKDELLSWHRCGAQILGLDRFPPEVRDAILPARSGLTLAFDSRLHRFDTTAFDALILEILGPDTDVVVEERSSLANPGASFVRINGLRPDDLVTVAERFYQRAWGAPQSQTETSALQSPLSASVAALVARLDDMRDRLTEMTATPGLFEGTGEEAVPAHNLTSDRSPDLSGRYQAIADALAFESTARHNPPDIATFLKQLHDDLHRAVRQLESQRHHVQRRHGDVHTHDDEESLRSRLHLFLRGRGYECTAETDEAGATDLLVACPKLDLLWVGECKVHSAYEDLDEGMLQLHTRYASGRHPELGFIIFCFNRDAASVLATWKARVMEQQLCGLIGEPEDDPLHRLSFVTKHRHVGSGLELQTRHILVTLYHRPADRSARRSQAS